MAEDVEAPPEQQAPSKGFGLWVWGLVCLIAGSAGAAVPLLFVQPAPQAVPAARTQAEIPGAEETAYVSYGEVIVNLADSRMTRYLRLALTLQIPKAQQEDFNKRLESKRVVLKNWLLSHISDKQLDDIRGAAGQNMLRREIRDQFNMVLYPEGFDRVYDVLFDEFNVQ